MLVYTWSKAQKGALGNNLVKNEKREEETVGERGGGAKVRRIEWSVGEFLCPLVTCKFHSSLSSLICMHVYCLRISYANQRLSEQLIKRDKTHTLTLTWLPLRGKKPHLMGLGRPLAS